jgi:hypothetical protein
MVVAVVLDEFHFGAFTNGEIEMFGSDHHIDRPIELV